MSSKSKLDRQYPINSPRIEETHPRVLKCDITKNLERKDRTGCWSWLI